MLRILIGSVVILGVTLITNQVFHGGLRGPIHNKSVKPKLEISSRKLNKDNLSSDVFRTEGVDVYDAWIIGIELLDNQDQTVLRFSQTELACPGHQSDFKLIYC